MTPQLDTLAELLAKLQPYFEKIATLDVNERADWSNDNRLWPVDARRISEQLTSLRDNLPAIREQAEDVERVRQALAARDAKASECPDKKLDAKKDCPRCGANSNEGCRVTALADAAFVHNVRAALNPKQENSNG